MADKNPKFIKKIGSDGYVRPAQTATDKLTPEEIEAKLEDYTQVTDLAKVPIGVHLRYFVLEDGKRKFRPGGILHKNDGLPLYVYLSNGTQSWAVQVQDTIFFRKMTIKEMKEDYAKQIDELQKKNDKLVEENKKLLEENKQIMKFIKQSQTQKKKMAIDN